MYLPGIALAHPDHAQTSTSGAAAKSNINDNGQGRRRQQLMLTFASLYLPSRTSWRVGRLPTISTVQEESENEKNLPFRAVVEIRRPVEYLEPRRSASMDLNALTVRGRRTTHPESKDGRQDERYDMT